MKAALSLSSSSGSSNNNNNNNNNNNYHNNIQQQQPFAPKKDSVSVGEQGCSSMPSFGARQAACFPPERSMESGSATATPGEGVGEEAVRVGGVTASDGCAAATDRRLPDGWRLLPRIDGRRLWPMGVYIDGE